MADKKIFDLSALIDSVPDLGTGRQQITYIPIDKIDPDPDNFYSLDGIGELAGSIEMLGLQQPLVVCPNGSRFTVISGHRRRAAIMLIRDGGSKQFAEGVPCILDEVEASDALRRLKLIMANSDTRKMTSADQNRQAEEIQDLLRQLVDEGYEFPGRLRDWVAQLSGMSRSKLNRLKVIRDNLLPELKRDYYEKGKMNESVAYAMAQQPQAIQKDILAMREKAKLRVDYMGESYVRDYCEMRAKFAKLKCKMDGAPCINQDRLLDKVMDQGCSYKPCRYNNCCCAECSEYVNCRDRCPKMDEKAKAIRDQKREASKAERAAVKSKEEQDVRDIEQVWARFGQALFNAGLTDKQLRDSLKEPGKTYNPFELYMNNERIDALEDFSCGDVKPNEKLPFNYSFRIDDLRMFCHLADALGCSLDYLFLRDDQPARDAVPDPGTMTATWRQGDPQDPGRYLCLVDLDMTQYSEQKCDWTGERWEAYGRPIDDMFKVVGWWPLPKDNRLPMPEPEEDAG